MSDKNPCIDCITYAICKPKVMDFIKQSFPFITNPSDDTYPYQWRDSIISAYYIHFKDRCSLIVSYIKSQKKLDPNTSYYLEMQIGNMGIRDQIIHQAMCQSFQIEPIKEIQ